MRWRLLTLREFYSSPPSVGFSAELLLRLCTIIYIEYIRNVLRAIGFWAGEAALDLQSHRYTL